MYLPAGHLTARHVWRVCSGDAQSRVDPRRPTIHLRAGRSISPASS